MKLLRLISASLLLSLAHLNAQTAAVTKVPSGTANAGTLTDGFHVPTGKIITIDSGATIANNGTATGFDAAITFANATARAAATPEFIGQSGFQVDTTQFYYGSALSPGAWSSNFIFDSLLTTSGGALFVLGSTSGQVGIYATATAGNGNISIDAGANTFSLVNGTAGVVVPAGVSGTLRSIAFVTSGTGVNTALAVNVGSAGAFVTFNGALGTPSSGTLTNATGLPVVGGISGLGTGVATFLATPSSANLAAAITNETGTAGSVVFSVSPNLTTPNIGAATANSINGLTITASTGTLTIANGKTFTSSNTITLAGTDSKTYTFPTTDATIARTDAAQTLTGTQTISGGNLALPATTSTTGQLTLGGTRMLHSYGTQNVFIGDGAGNFTLSGSSNTGLGRAALLGLTSGARNVGIGDGIMFGITSGSDNLGIGYSALNASTTGSQNVGVGTSALVHATGANGIGIGYQAGYAIGAGNGNVSIGQTSAANAANGYATLTSVANCTAIGDVSELTTAGQTTASYRTAIGAGSNASADNQVMLGRSADSVNVPSLTASKIVLTDASKNLVSAIGTPTQVVAFGRVTAQTAAAGTVATYTAPAADGTYEVSANVNVTTATAHSFSVTCAYTDETNTGRTITMPFIQVGGVTVIGTITNITGAGPYEGIPLHLRVKASTAITVATTGTFTTVTYNAEGVIKNTQ